MKSLSKTAPQVDPILLASLYGAEFALVLIGLTLNKLASQPLAAWPSSGAARFLCGSSSARHRARAGRPLGSTRTGSRGFGFTVAMNLITLALVVMPLEIALRVLSRDSADAPIFGDRALLPRSWDKAVEHYRQQMDKAGGMRRTSCTTRRLDGRSVPAAEVATEFISRVLKEMRGDSGFGISKGHRKATLAIVGDSVAFAQYVKFEESFGHLFERAFSPKVEVLNFGVPGYGVDQALVKLEKHVLAWKPDVVVFGFIEANFSRTMTVYPFINWQDWNMPFSKPRFVLNQGELPGLTSRRFRRRKCSQWHRFPTCRFFSMTKVTRPATGKTLCGICRT